MREAVREFPSGTVLAFDFGARRIGVAVGDLALKTAHPLTTVAAHTEAEIFARIAALIAEWRPSLLVVGVPAHADGREHETGRRCRKFAQRLHGRFGVRVELADERLTSCAADSMLREAGVFGAKRKTALDQVAAQQILQTFLERHATA